MGTRGFKIKRTEYTDWKPRRDSEGVARRNHHPESRSVGLFLRCDFASRGGRRSQLRQRPCGKHDIITLWGVRALIFTQFTRRVGRLAQKKYRTLRFGRACAGFAVTMDGEGFGRSAEMGGKCERMMGLIQSDQGPSLLAAAKEARLSNRCHFWMYLCL